MVLPELLRMARYPFEEVNLPALEAISEAVQSGFGAGRSAAKVPSDSRKIDDLVVRVFQAANAVTGVFGLNPVETVLNRVLDQLEDQAEEQPRRRRRPGRERTRVRR